MSGDLRAVAAALRRRWRRLRSLGARGERAAARWLERRGYEVLHRNLRLAGAEADIVLLAPDGRCLVVAEVKTLAGAGTHPSQRVDQAKRRRLGRLGQQLLRRRAHRLRGLRFDILSVRPRRLGPWVVGWRIEHHPGAFDPSGRAN